MTRRKEPRHARKNTNEERMWKAEKRKQASIVVQFSSIESLHPLEPPIDIAIAVVVADAAAVLVAIFITIEVAVLATAAVVPISISILEKETFVSASGGVRFR